MIKRQTTHFRIHGEVLRTLSLVIHPPQVLGSRLTRAFLHVCERPLHHSDVVDIHLGHLLMCIFSICSYFACPSFFVNILLHWATLILDSCYVIILHITSNCMHGMIQTEA